MTDPMIHVPEIIKFTDNAAYKVAELIFEEENLNLKLRAYITGGGCSGFQYGFTFDEKIDADDTIIKKIVTLKKEDPLDIEVILLVDPMSIQYLAGAKIDYKEDLAGARFIIEQNPNAKTTCGCGQSFSVDEED
jgi:iron-sulfur cluster insertion protein